MLKNLITQNTPLLISGPCSAETEEQVQQSFNLLVQNCRPHVLRAGIWKPRTRPGEFEGVGKIGLQWLKEAGTKHNLPVSTEVANAQHVECALAAGIDMLWIGARTTVNPFSVQEIANALKGVKIPVLIKNPVNPDLNLWLGAIERIQRADIADVAAIHRGFTATGKSPFRNDPNWDLAIQLKQLCPELPIICDPSHIAGRRDLIALISQRALDLDFQGLMIESHCNPDEAWTDAKQQVSPENLACILDSLVKRKAQSESTILNGALEEIRHDIDQIDEQIIHSLAERMQLVSKIGQFKLKHDLTILQINRWDEILKKRSEMGEALGLDPSFTKKILKTLHAESIRKQNEIMNAKWVKAS